MAGDRDQIAEHRVAHRRRDFGVGQRIQPHVDHRAFADDLHPVEDRSRVGQVGIVRCEQLRDLAGGELLQQRQQRSDDLVEVGPVVAHGAAQAVEHRVIDAHLGQVLFEGHHALLAPDHVARDVLLVQLRFELDDDLPGLRLVLGEVVLGVLDEQRVDVDDVALDQQVVRPLPQLDQGARDDVDEAPGEFAERGAVAFARELSGDARGHLGDPPEPADGVVARRDVRPAQMEHVELAFAPGALGLDVHALQQVRIALGVEDDHHLVLAADLAADVLRDEQLGQPRLAHARGAQHQGVADTLAQRQGDVDLVRLDAMQARQSADRRQRPRRVERAVPGQRARQRRDGKRRELKPLLQPPGGPVGRRRLDIAAELRPVGLHQPVRVPLLPAKAPADEQPLLTHRHVATCHHVARQAADVAAIAQDRPGIAQANRAEGQEGQRRAQAEQRVQRERPRCHQAQNRGAGADRHGIKLHRWPQQDLDRMRLGHLRTYCSTPVAVMSTG